VALTHEMGRRRQGGQIPVSGGVSGTQGWTNCSVGGEGGWGCPGFDRSHAEKGERVKGAHPLHGSEVREENGGGGWRFDMKAR
jgi:hypothetical protein